ncbi:MAG: C1 family peptidase [Candidatus Eisenbacteria bacterium]
MSSFALAGKTGSPGGRPALLLVFLLALPTLAAGSSEESPMPVVGAMNPAALYCIELGYGYEVISTAEGERGVCVLPDGRRVDAWAFFRGRVAREYSWCALQGWTVETREIGGDSYTAECAVCVDENGAEIGSVEELMGLADRALRGFGAPVDPDRAAGIRPSAPGRALPTSYNWCDLGGCTPVKSQGSCGSCWAFGTAAPLECNIKIKDGVTVNLSEQYLVSCNSDGWSCSGGWWAHDYHHWKNDPCGDNGAVLEADFPYTATDEPCGCPYPHHYWIDWWEYIGEPWGVSPTDAMKQAILDHGPISVAVDASGFSGYSGGVFTSCSGTSINHAVALVGWDDNQGTDGVWILRNSWGASWGENGYMRIPYGCNSVGYNSCWVHYRDPIRLSLEGDMPESIDPDLPTTITVRIEELTDTYVAGSGLLHCRFGEGEWQSVPLDPAGGGLHEASIPGSFCDERTCELYLSAEAAGYGGVVEPYDAPATVFRAVVGQLQTVFSDDFEGDLGWTVVNDGGLTDGPWERGIPAGGGTRGDPPSDFDGSGSCYLTDNVEGNSDVDGGSTRLLSPALDLLPGNEYRAGFALWYTNSFGNDPHNDCFEVHVSNDNGGTWVVVDSIGPHTVPGWTEHWFLIGDYVAPTSQVKVRFTASDLSDGSVVEAGVDAFRVELLQCVSTGVSASVPAPAGYALHGGVPNPFNPTTEIRYEVPRPGPVAIAIHDVAGRRVALLAYGHHEAGSYSKSWDGRNALGEEVASGVYFVRMEAACFEATAKTVLIR